MKDNKRIIIIFFVTWIGCILCSLCIAGLLLASGILSFSNEIKQTEQDQKIRDENEKLEKDNYLNPAKIGSVIKIDQTEWTLTESKNLGSKLGKKSATAQDCIAKEGNRYVYVKLNAKNTSNQTITFANLKIVDKDRNQYSYDYDSFNCYNVENSSTLNLYTGLQQEFIIIYQVPVNSTDLKLKISKTGNLDSKIDYFALGF